MAQQSAWSPEDFSVVSGPASPRVAYALKRMNNTLLVNITVASFYADGSHTAVALGVAAAKRLILSDADAKITRRGADAQYLFTIPATALVNDDTDWKKLRLGFSVAWTGGALGEDRQRERFLHLNAGAAHATLANNPAEWLPIDLDEYDRLVTDRKNRIDLEFVQPMDGKATIVIEDNQGKRIRNLVSGRSYNKGTYHVTWDGLDEQGNVVKPGSYRWRAIHHPGIKPEYLFSFANDGTPSWRTRSGTDMWGPDHSNITAAAAGKEWTFLGGSVAESGYAIVAVDQQGIKRMNYDAPNGTGLATVALATDDEFLYAAHDGLGWGTRSADRSKANWVDEHKLTIIRYDIKSGNVIDYPRGQRFVTVSVNRFGPGVNKPERLNLAGLAVMDNRLYISTRAFDSILVLDAKTLEKVTEIAVKDPGALQAFQGQLFAVSGDSVVRINPGTGQTAPVIPVGVVKPAGIACDAKGNLYVSDSTTNTVKVFTVAGKAIRTIGKPGGDYKGAFDSERIVNPRGLAVATNGWLWVTENRGTPKRVVAWDLATGKVVKEKFGPTAYGASGAGFDYQDHTRWIGQGATWKLDFEKKTAQCTSILGASTGRGNKIYRQDGRTFVIGAAKVTTISELLPDGSMKNLALLASTHQFCYYFNWKPAQAFVDAFNQAYPNLKGKPDTKGPGVLWVDKNGDGEFQTEEFEFSTAAESFAGSGWSHEFGNLTMRVPARVKGKAVMVTLKPDGYYPGGAPKYPGLNDACLAGVPIDLRNTEIETTIDRFGNMIVNSDPEMKSFAPDGTTLWTYPNRWTNVHGSHDAPLPEVGMMQGALFFLGVVPLDEKTDVFVMNGNHGRFFVLTSDGFYLDEMFKDVRTGATVDAYMIGGECFGGFFGRSEKDGNYYLQSGHTDYRIFRIDGLRDLKRTQGTINVSATQVVAAENSLKRKIADTIIPKIAVVPVAQRQPVIDGRETDWPAAVTLSWNKSNQYPVQVRALYDDTNLYLHYTVDDSSPWVNNGKDWTTLFKTGDSINVELGTDAAANPKRSQPVPGDLRLLIAPYQGRIVVVLYRHRVPGTKTPMMFTSPWRAEPVDVVKVIDTAQVVVMMEKARYRLEAAIPLAELGLTAPAGKTFKADFGVIYGDAGGAINMLRSYWSNQQTNLVNDVPGEIMLSPSLWGAVTFMGRN